VELKGDVLVKCYHHDNAKGTAIPMFAVAFHTGFVNNGVLRVHANDIDGAKNNGRFPRNFFVDLIFSFDPGHETSSQPPQNFQGVTEHQIVKETSKKVMKKVSRPYASGFSTASVEANEEEEVHNYSLNDDDEAPKSLSAKKSSDDYTAGLIHELDGIDHDLSHELDKYASELQSFEENNVSEMNAGTGEESLDDAVVVADSGDDNDNGDEDFDIDAFAEDLGIDLGEE
jgi:hypothetical protein